MTAGRLMAAFLLLVGCSTSEDRAKIKQMDEIERTINIPGPGRVKDYSRYYATQSDGKIAVLYVVHPASYLQEMRYYCSRERINAFPCDADGRSRLVPPGGRLWLDDERDLPSKDGGSCANIRFTYDPASKARPVLRCNGSY
jgi:hypothetical protein